jgi:Zn-dependent protease with chaperone function
MAIVRRAWWSVVENGIPILIVAFAFEAFYAGRYVGILWLFGAAAIHRIGLVCLRLAEGMRFNRLKSGELRNRSMAIARKMEIPLKSVCMVPAGKGHMSNAFGASNMIALTDALPKYLNERQVDSVIAHELIHVKHKHARLESIILILSYSALLPLTFRISSRMMQFRPLLDLIVVYLPAIVSSYSSRRSEFEADREAVLFTGDPETSIRALANLYRSSSVPFRISKLSELFQTHPSLIRRVLAIAKTGELREERVSKILKETGLLTATHRQTEALQT